jgi:hypothetical protein
MNSGETDCETSKVLAALKFVSLVLRNVETFHDNFSAGMYSFKSSVHLRPSAVNM